jgi:hypothetical protein
MIKGGSGTVGSGSGWVWVVPVDRGDQRGSNGTGYNIHAWHNGQANALFVCLSLSAKKTNPKIKTSHFRPYLGQYCHSFNETGTKMTARSSAFQRHQNDNKQPLPLTAPTPASARTAASRSRTLASPSRSASGRTSAESESCLFWDMFLFWELLLFGAEFSKSARAGKTNICFYI